MKQLASTYEGKKALVIGMGISGQSAARFLMKRGMAVTGMDMKTDLPETDPAVAELCRNGMLLITEHASFQPAEFDLAVVSPGISSAHPWYQKALESGLEVVGEVELACREISCKCAAVTGTNGKTTVAMLTAHVLQTAGLKAKALGNIGIPLTSAVDEMSEEQPDHFIVELSSFQLETMKTPFIDAGVILNITPDHLDRYPTFHDYAAAKIGMQKNIREGGKLFVESRCLDRFRRFFAQGFCSTYGYSPEDELHTDLYSIWKRNQMLFELPEAYRSRRSHDVENLMASYALCSHFSITPEQFLSAVSTFKKPSHRIEFVRSLRGVGYYDDSKGTNIDAVIRAVESMSGKVVLIAGGVEKGSPYSPWIEAFGGKVKAVCAVGEAKEKIRNDLGGYIPVVTFSHFDDAVAHASAIAKPGENVLLSPGCSSFDLFKDYAHRGTEFQRIVHEL